MRHEEREQELTPQQQREVVRLAAELQARSAENVTLSELIAAAEEAGIPGKYIHAALRRHASAKGISWSGMSVMGLWLATTWALGGVTRSSAIIEVTYLLSLTLIPAIVGRRTGSRLLAGACGWALGLQAILLHTICWSWPSNGSFFWADFGVLAVPALIAATLSTRNVRFVEPDPKGAAILAGILTPIVFSLAHTMPMWTWQAVIMLLPLGLGLTKGLRGVLLSFVASFAMTQLLNAAYFFGDPQAILSGCMAGAFSAAIALGALTIKVAGKKIFARRTALKCQPADEPYVPSQCAVRKSAPMQPQNAPV
jgi:hypothetical protein